MRALTKALIASMTVSVAGHAQLLNGDLELPDEGGPNEATGWTLVETAGLDTASFQAFANHTETGDRGLWFRPFEASEAEPSVAADLYQEVPAAAGIEYALSAWFRFEVGYSGLDTGEPTQTLLALEFRNAGGVLSSAVIDIDTLYDGAAGINTWQQFQVIGTSPPGTTIVRVRASMVDGVDGAQNPQSAFVDDFVLSPQLIFADGFETGDTTRWSATVP